MDICEWSRPALWPLWHQSLSPSLKRTSTCHQDCQIPLCGWVELQKVDCNQITMCGESKDTRIMLIKLWSSARIQDLTSICACSISPVTVDPTWFSGCWSDRRRFVCWSKECFPKTPVPLACCRLWLLVSHEITRIYSDLVNQSTPACATWRSWSGDPPLTPIEPKRKLSL